jgi:hypothetical protein
VAELAFEERVEVRANLLLESNGGERRTCLDVFVPNDRGPSLLVALDVDAQPSPSDVFKLISETGSE